MPTRSISFVGPVSLSLNVRKLFQGLALLLFMALFSPMGDKGVPQDGCKLLLTCVIRVYA